MRLYNTLTRTVEQMVTRDEGRVSLYVCGPTVQAAPHFGHARAALVPDVFRRFLEWQGQTVLHVRNITDVDDKIIAKAAEEDRHPAIVAEHYARVYEEQIARLGILPPHIVPRATGHITDMIELIQRLVEVGAAYEAGGDVLFAVRSFAEYGQLSGRDIDELRSGARVDVDENKRDPLDFVLWKAAKPGEPSWPSPWGRGRPGWHIECSAMAGKYLGPSFDVHAGGIDLVFPHHENEIAQSEAAAGRRFARYWLHNGHLMMGSDKMSKSVGNVISLGEALDRYGAATLRMFYLQAHYRSPVEFSGERLDEAHAAVERWRSLLRVTRGLPEPEGEPPAAVVAVRERFIAAMEDDLGTPGAQAALFDLVSGGHQALADGRPADATAAAALLRELSGVLGYDLEDRAQPAAAVGPLVEIVLALREEARSNRDFATADDLRARLAAAGVLLEDTPDGPRWEVGAVPPPAQPADA